VPKKKTKKTVPAPVLESDSDDEDDDAPREDHPFEAVAALDYEDPGLAANAEVPMEFEGEHLTASELASVDAAEKEFAKKVHTLAAEADAVFEKDFGIKCTDAERKSASRIMDIVCRSCLYFLLHFCSFYYSLPNLHQKSTTLPSCSRRSSISSRV
jgi:hypothetical protein